ncbi:MAG: glycosyl hydrolase family 39 [Puia sp.]
MKKNKLKNFVLLFLMGLAGFVFAIPLQAQQDSVTIDWNKTVFVSKTTPTLQVVEMPRLRFPKTVHDNVFKALKELGADYVRYVPWFPYPKLAVAELKPPAKDRTYWDFTYLDSTMKALMDAMHGHSVVINFSTIPAWMWKTDAAVNVPDDPYQTVWDYNQGTQLRDTTLEVLTGYFGRLLSWYTRGGFTDELGKYHQSGLHYKIPYWEVLNEPDLEHSITPQIYCKMYDAVVKAMKKISPGTKFIGMGLAFESNPEWFNYFLNPAHHQAGIPLDGISYHHYSGPSGPGQSVEQWQYIFFDRVDGFLDKVRYIESIRKKYYPKTITTVNEIGTIISENPTKEYQCLSGAMFAYMFLELTKLGIDVAGESQLMGYPSNYPDVSMTNWETGKPNPRFWVLKLLKDNLGPGDKLVETNQTYSRIISQAVLTSGGRKLLLINQNNKEMKLKLPEEARSAGVDYVDETTNENPPVHVQLEDRVITLSPFEVAVVQVK